MPSRRPSNAASWRCPRSVPRSASTRLLAGWDPERLMVFCDEDADVADPLSALAAEPRGPVAVIIGPEGGFDAAERAALLALPRHLRLSLGPRILRADTAAVAALALVGAVLGDIGGPLTPPL